MPLLNASIKKPPKVTIQFMLHHDPAAKTHDRIGFTITLAVALHAAVILGVGFVLNLPTSPTTTRMDITLSNHNSDKPILDADFVAQTNQEASGSQSKKKELTTTELAPINSSEVKKFNPSPPSQAKAQPKEDNRLHVVSTIKNSPLNVAKKKRRAKTTRSRTQRRNETITARARNGLSTS